MEIEAESKLTTLVVLRGVGKAIASVAGTLVAVSILPSVPYAFLAGMETDRSAAMLYAYTPLLLAISVVAALCCLARITILRFVLAVTPVTLVFANWLT